MTLLIFPDAAHATAVIDEVAYTPPIEGESGGVKLGTGTAGADGRIAVAHRFAETQEDWLRAYLAELNAEVANELPQGWQWAATE